MALGQGRIDAWSDIWAGCYFVILAFWHFGILAFWHFGI
jgi:hypothetical protein